MAKYAQYLIDTATAMLQEGRKTGEGGWATKKHVYGQDIDARLRPQLSAIVLGVQEQEQLLHRVAEANGLYSATPPECQPLDKDMLLILLYEALLGSRRVRGTHPLTKFVQSRKSSLQQTLAALRKKGSAAAFVEKIHLPRYVRVNELRLTADAGLQHFLAQGYQLKDMVCDGNFVRVEPRCVAWDPCVRGLLVLPERTNLHEDEFVQRGELVLQDRSSCLSALALDPPSGAHCIDACAAPGNKTAHVAALLKGTGCVHAFERSSSRFQILSSQMRRFGAHNVTPRHEDFTGASVTDPLYKDVTHILVDPTCSGSGLVNIQQQQKRVEDNKESAADEQDVMGGESVASLAANQLKLLVHAMSFPSAQVVVYSTCSVYEEENEDVVASVLQRMKGTWRVVRTLPQWPHRGNVNAKTKLFASLVVRAHHKQDNTNGFFVCRFERVMQNAGLMSVGESLNGKKGKSKAKRKRTTEVTQPQPLAKPESKLESKPESKPGSKPGLTGAKGLKKRKLEEKTEQQKSAHEIKMTAASVATDLSPAELAAKALKRERIKKRKAERKAIRLQERAAREELKQESLSQADTPAVSGAQKSAPHFKRWKKKKKPNKGAANS